MTIRLVILAAIGALLAGLTWHFLWPVRTQTPVGGLAMAAKTAPSVTSGAYFLKNQSGIYNLHLYDDRTARLEFVDRKAKHFGYRGEVVEGKIVWKQTLRGKKWIDVIKPVDDMLAIESATVVVIREGKFRRVNK